MCGIFGVLGKSLSTQSHETVAQALDHRGPDGQGIYVSDNIPATIGMTRLAILDLERGQQPFVSTDGQVRAVCNGEIYNWRELRLLLQQDGYQFETECDAEILPAGWQVWGEGLFQRLNGMFALAICDESRGEVILARDPCGQKPLYWTPHDGGFYFASELKGLQAYGCELSPNRDAVEQYLLLRYVSQPQTAYAGVKQVEGGHFLKWSSKTGLGTPQRWWRAPRQTTERSLSSDNITHLGALVDREVAASLQSEVPLGVYLSAGVDSAVLLESIARQSNGGTNAPVCTFTAGFGAESDEVTYARKLAQRYNFAHEEVTLSSTDLSSLPRVVQQMEVPVGDGLILAFDRLAQAAQARGCKVVMGGEGPDELFLGYSFQKVQWLAELMGRLPRTAVTAGLQYAPEMIVENFSSFPAALGKSGRDKLARWFGKYTYAHNWWQGMGLRTVFEPKEVSRLLGCEPSYHPALPQGESVLEQHYRNQFYEWLPDWSIIRQDRNAMAHSVEYRMPFLSPDLIEFSGGVPLSQKLRPSSTKWIWRQMAQQRLGGGVASRTKQPFYFPLEEYATSPEYLNLIEEYLSAEAVERVGVFDPEVVSQIVAESQSGEFLLLKKVFSLLIYQIWMQGGVN